jgi:hypothetical protein
MPHPRKLWPSAMQLWDPEILQNLSSVLPTYWVYKCKLWSRDNARMIWCSILYVNFVGNVQTLPAVQFSRVPRANCRFIKSLVPTVTHCDARNARRHIKFMGFDCLLYAAFIWFPVSCASHREFHSRVRGLFCIWLICLWFCTNLKPLHPSAFLDFLTKCYQTPYHSYERLREEDS